MKKKKKRGKKKGKGVSSKDSSSDGVDDDDLAHVVPQGRAGLRHEGGVDIQIDEDGVDVSITEDVYMDENGNWVSEETDPSGKDVTILDEPPQRQR